MTERVIHLARAGGIGDILMCTPALKALKAAAPERQVAFFGAHLELLSGLPYIDKLAHFDERPPGALWLNYEGADRVNQHIARHFAQQAGVSIPDVRPDCFVDADLVAHYQELLGDLPRPWVVINRRASGWTPNKDWSDEKWTDLVTRLRERCGVIEIGGAELAPVVPPGRNYHGLLGRTTLHQMVAVIAAADIVVSPISGPVHVAAATRTPSVVIYGGYELPVGTAYDGNEVFYSAVECAPCWLTGPCPNGRKCLAMISVADVEAAVWKIWRSHMTVTQATASESRESRMEDPRAVLHGKLAVPLVLHSRDRLYVAYRPDSDIMYDRHPEMRALADGWVNGNARNNSGDLPRFYMLALNVKAVMADKIPGQFAELGVYRGNSAAVLAHYARQHGRELFLFDTFQGFAQGDLRAVDAGKKMEFEDTSPELVLRNTGSQSVNCIEGRFPGSVTPEIAAERFAVVHLDCDLYDPMKAALEFFYPRLSPGGLLIVHDYVNEYWDGVRLAVDEFRAGIPEQFVIIPDKSGSAVLRKAR